MYRLRVLLILNRVFHRIFAIYYCLYIINLSASNHQLTAETKPL